eukprot:11300338-Karenia_brevis.AAC.1
MHCLRPRPGDVAATLVAHPWPLLPPMCEEHVFSCLYKDKGRTKSHLNASCKKPWRLKAFINV